MNYLNLETKIANSPEYVGSKPVQRATWLNVSLWSAEQENGGRIVGGLGWSDRQWQQTCGVTKREVRGAANLLKPDGQDLIVWSYPAEQEATVKSKRATARINGLTGGRPLKDKPISEPTLVSASEPISESVREGKGKEEEGKGEGNDAAPNPSSRLMLTQEQREEAMCQYRWSGATLDAAIAYFSRRKARYPNERTAEVFLSWFNEYPEGKEWLKSHPREVFAPKARPKPQPIVAPSNWESKIKANIERATEMGIAWAVGRDFDLQQRAYQRQIVKFCEEQLAIS